MATVRLLTLCPRRIHGLSSQKAYVSTALYQSGVALPNGEMDAQLRLVRSHSPYLSGMICQTLKRTSRTTIQPF